MSSCKLVIRDEVNVKFENLSLEWRKRLSNKFKYEIPYARHLPAVKLGRWDGKVGFFGLGGNGYVNHLDTIINLLLLLYCSILIGSNIVKVVIFFQILLPSFSNNACPAWLVSI